MKEQNRINNGSTEVSTVQLVYRIVYVLILLYCTYEIYLNIRYGYPKSHLLFYLLLMSAPGGVYRILSARNEKKGDAEELKRHDKTLLLYIFLAIIITFVFISAVVLFM